MTRLKRLPILQTEIADIATELAGRHCKDCRDCWNCRDRRECRPRLPRLSGLTILPRVVPAIAGTNDNAMIAGREWENT